jgi:hypothetical protein
VIKRIAIVLLQLFVTAAGIFYVFHDAQKRAQIGHALQTADWRWLAIGWVVYGVVELLATMRWQLLLRVQGIKLGWLRAGVIVVIGLFFNMVLPGLVGGDAARLLLVFKTAPRQKTRATLSVAMDRLLGLFSLLVLAALVVALRLDWLRQFPDTAKVTYVALALLAGVSFFMLLLLGVIGSRRRRKLSRRVPFRKQIVETGNALHLYRAHLITVAIAFALTIFSHVGYYLSYFCAMRSLAAPGVHMASVTDVVSIMPLVNTITGVPVSFGGVGVRETLFQTLFGKLADVPPALAALSASLGYLIQASWGVVGGLAYLLMFRPAKEKTGRRQSTGAGQRREK